MESYIHHKWFMRAILNRHKYDSFVIWLYTQGKEDLLPSDFKKSIPCSTRSTWKSIDYSSYIGNEFRVIQQEGLEYYELFLKYRNLKKVVYCLARIWIVISKVVLPIVQKNKEFRKAAIDPILNLSETISKRVVFRLFGFSAASFHYLLRSSGHLCSQSAILLCKKQHPNQLSTQEVNTIRSLFSDTRFVCWPSASIHYFAGKNGQLHISLSTFYKYVALLGLKRKWSKAIPKTTGIKASLPNQYLHVDTTRWEFPDGSKAYIALVTDNFSRAIIGCSIDRKNTSTNVIQALRRAIASIHQYHPDHTTTLLVADGGSENHARTVDELIRTTSIPSITKIIAQKDITFSNSSVEAANKILKRYLRIKRPAHYAALLKIIPEIVHDYNFIRPHISLKGAEPMNAYSKGIIPRVQNSHEVREARIKRTEENRKGSCGACE